MVEFLARVGQPYLENIPLEEALRRYLEALEQRGALQPGEPERIPVNRARGRVTARPVFAAVSSPHYHAAAMDGVAVQAAATFGASETTPLRLRLGSEAVVVDTGDPLPQGFNAVIMIEDLHFPEEDTVEIIAPAVPWQHVRVVGEDFIETEMVLPAHQRITPYDIGGLLTAGVTEVVVFPKVRVALLPTGTEIVPPGTPLKPGDVIESNSRVLGGLVEEWGGEPVIAPVTVDDYELLKQRILEYLDRADLLAVIAGSSHGREDYTVPLFRELGEVFVHGVAIRPGKPVSLGVIRGKPVIGVPGYPVSAALAFELFARPVVYRKHGLPLPPEQYRKAVVSRKIVSPLGAEEFIRVRLGKVRDRLLVQPLPRGAGAVTSLVQADGILRVPRLSEGYPAGAEVEVRILRPEGIPRTTVVVGSHDMVLDIMANLMQEKHPGFRLISSHVGSMGGLTAVGRGEAHMAGIHLLDESTGEYNTPYVRRILGGKKAYLVNLSYRIQGILVQRGNPHGITKLADLTRPGLKFINRQRGSGTRLLLDYLLRQEGISPLEIEGYGREEYTHMAVAVAVASGSADAGLGIQAAASALNLDFIPVGEERYDLCIPADLWEEKEVTLVLDLLKDPDFRRLAERMRGYDFRDCGKIVGETE
ncbi:molybdopterin biosynthesis protein [Thermacetogenium phaeum]|uniref:molybdopterin biosynthesis protein n=1 Tax=Thermacetogenium phaeum TaxID=85874 RepID=UPI0002E80E2F|nr:molybdopterin biosynthesis protein [Thermacetogenium phaeum]